jgi:hypothetical protein
MDPVDTHAAADNSASTAVPQVGAAAIYNRPAPRDVKEKRYREIIVRNQSRQRVSLVEHLLGTIRALRSLDTEARKQSNRDIATFFKYYDCEEFGEFDASGQWQPDAQNTEDFAYSLPLVKAHVDSAKTLLSKVELEYEYEAKDKVSMIDDQLARMCTELGEEEMERIFTGDLRGRERLFLLTAGKSYRCHPWGGNSLEPNTVEVPIYSNEEQELEDDRVCANPECGTPLGTADSVCPKCLSAEINVVAGGKTMKITESARTVALAENQMYVPNPLAIQHDLSKTRIENGFFIERDALPRAEAEFLYCQTFSASNRSLSSELNMMRDLERTRLRTGSERDSALRGFSELFMTDTSLVERERVWLEPWRYANIAITEDRWFYSKRDGLVWCDKDEDVPENARPVKAGTLLGDLFAKGAFVCVVDDVLVEINGKQVGDLWIKLIYGMRPANTDGSGLQSIRPLADMANDATNLEMKSLLDDADPKTFLNRRYLSSLAKVGEFNIIDNLQQGESWEQVVYRLQGASAHRDLGAMNDRIQAFTQFTAGTYSSMGAGAPDIKAFGTATGVVAMAEEAAGRFIEAIEQTVMADINSRYKVLRNIQSYSIDAQKNELKKRFGSQVVERFFICNLRKSVAIRKKKGTDQPRSNAVRIAQLTAYSQAVGSIPADNANGVSLTEHFAELIDLPITVGAGLADKEEAERRIGLLREASQQFDEKNLDPQAALDQAMKLVSMVLVSSEKPTIEDIAPPPAPPPAEGEEPIPPPAPKIPTMIMMQDHAVFMDTYKDWILTEGARSENDVLKTAVQTMWRLHYDRQTAKQEEMVRLQGEAQRTLAPPPPPEQPAEDPVAGEALTRAADEHAQQADFERQETSKNNDLNRKRMEMEYQHELAKEQAATAVKAIPAKAGANGARPAVDSNS